MEMIGFVGLGTIGGAIARNIHNAGHSLMIHDILPDAVRPTRGGWRSVGSIARGNSPRSAGSYSPPSQGQRKWRKSPLAPMAF